MPILKHHRAGYPAVWIATAEPGRLTAEIRAEFGSGDTAYGAVIEWDCLAGASIGGARAVGSDPVEAIQWYASPAAAQHGPSALIVHLGHRFAGSPDVIQAIMSGCPIFAGSGRQIVIVAPPGATVPPELARVVARIDHALPDDAALAAVVERIARDNADAVTLAAPAEEIAARLRGLTAGEAENLVALAAVEHGGEVSPGALAGGAATVIRDASGGALELRSPTSAGFESLGGLENLKEFAGRAALSPLARGIVLLGVPGTGKTAFADSLGAESRLPVYKWDLGRLFGSLVGESEAAARRAIAAIEAAGRCVLLIDEIEKGTAGMAGSSTDGGTTQRTMGTVLTWLSDRAPGGAYVIATCNDVAKIPPEMLRAERWDATFFVDLPSAEERVQIWGIHAAGHGLADAFDSDLTAGWTGAEIRSACRLAQMLGVPVRDAARYVVPIYRARGAEIDALRVWAAGRTVPASRAGTPPASAGEIITAAQKRRIMKGN